MSNTQTFSTTGPWTCPVGVTSVTAECWGGGANGGSYFAYIEFPNVYTFCGGGGGGGAYARKRGIPVTPGNSYTVTVGIAGGLSKFMGDSSSVCQAAGGSSPTGTYPANTYSGVGGSSIIGDIGFAGGDGGFGEQQVPAAGGGGAGAGSDLPGSNGMPGDAIGGGGAGAVGVDGGGSGGNGGSEYGPSKTPQPGTAPGGGGGGQNSGPVSVYTAGAAGSAGQVILTWGISLGQAIITTT